MHLLFHSLEAIVPLYSLTIIKLIKLKNVLTVTFKTSLILLFEYLLHVLVTNTYTKFFYFMYILIYILLFHLNKVIIFLQDYAIYIFFTFTTFY
jgi:hypothetical protein